MKPTMQAEVLAVKKMGSQIRATVLVDEVEADVILNEQGALWQAPLHILTDEEKAEVIRLIREEADAEDAPSDEEHMAAYRARDCGEPCR
jgi:hypothetical protein